MYGFPRELTHKNNAEWYRQRHPNNQHWRPRAPFAPRNQGFINYRPPMQSNGEEHWCETCDRGFPTEDLLIKHKQQHQKCNIDGCQFIAHPKVITKHIQMQHSSGLYKKIAKLNNPAEIEKWREERRKKYPTKINIDKKEAEVKEKIERGEKMGLGKREWRDKGGNREKREFRSGQGMKRGLNNDSQPGTKFRKLNNRRPKKPDIIPIAEDNRGLVSFTGIQSLVMDDDDEEVDETLNGDDLINDHALDLIEDNQDIVEKATVCGALSSLMCEYGSSDDEITESKNTRYNDKICIKSGDDSYPTQNGVKRPEVKNTSECHIKTNSMQEEVYNTKQFSTKPYMVSLEINNKKPTTSDEKSTKVLPKTDFCKTDVIRRKHDEASVASVVKTDLKEIDDGDESGPDEVKVAKNEAPVIIGQDTVETTNKIAKKKLEVRKKPVFRKPKPKIPSTLIYRLLSNEMKQERNIVLQCIRHIRKNNYFD